jgi:hypothetical protein
MKLPPDLQQKALVAEISLVIIRRKMAGLPPLNGPLSVMGHDLGMVGHIGGRSADGQTEPTEPSPMYQSIKIQKETLSFLFRCKLQSHLS